MAYIDKKLFCETLMRLREASDLRDKVNKLFQNSRENIECDYQNAAALQISHESSVVKLLTVAMDDKLKDIEYFIYELDYGRKYHPGSVTYPDGTELDISTAEKLYDWLMLNIECEKNLTTE